VTPLLWWKAKTPCCGGSVNKKQPWIKAARKCCQLSAILDTCKAYNKYESKWWKDIHIWLSIVQAVIYATLLIFTLTLVIIGVSSGKTLLLQSYPFKELLLSDQGRVTLIQGKYNLTTRNIKQSKLL
jgi:hypothetical protein